MSSILSQRRKGGSHRSSTRTSRSQSATWRSEILNVDIQKIENRSCEIILVAESNVNCSDIVDNIHYSAQSDPLNPVKLIRYSELIYNVTKSWGSQPKSNDALRRQASHEVVSILNENENISCEMLVFLIKMEIIKIISDDIRAEQEDTYLKTLEEQEYKKLHAKGVFGETEEEKESKKGSKKKDKKPAAKENKAGKKGKEKKNKEEDSDDECNIVTKEPRALSMFKVHSEFSHIPVKQKELYILLTGFYDPQLIETLPTVGVSVSCVLEVTKSDSILRTINDSPTSEKEELVIDAQRSDSLTEVYKYPSKENNSQVNLLSLSSDLEKPREVIIKEFWNKMVDLFHGQTLYPYTENAFHMIYCTDNLPIDDTDEDTVKKRFEDISNQVKKIPDLKRQYVNYTRNLKLKRLGELTKVLPAKCLKIYNKLMNKYPPECFSVALLLYCLIEEVCSHVHNKHDNGSEASFNIVTKDSANVVTDSAETVEIEDTEEPAVTDSIRDQVINLLRRYKKRHLPLSDEDKKLLRCHKCNYSPRIDLKPNEKSFMVHEKDKLQMLASSYKKVYKELFDINMNILRRCRPALLVKKHCGNSVLEKLINEYNIESCKSKLNLTKEQLNDAIHLYLFDKVKGKREVEPCDNEMSKLFPTKTRSILLNETKSRPFGYVDTESKDSVSISEHSETSSKSLTVSNLYETSNTAKYHRYKEAISSSVMLQELAKADFEYLCADYKYCSVTDALLFKFHNKLDNFGFTTTVFSQSLRTAVCLRDFCKYVIHEDAKWLEAQEKKHIEEIEAKQRELQRKREEKLQSLLPEEVVIDESIFIIPNSIKWQEQQKAAELAAMSKKSKGKPSSKEKKSAQKKSKGTAKKELIGLDTILESDEDDTKSVMVLRCAEEWEPFSFLGFDFGKNRVQVSGSSSIFHSLDGITVTIDNTAWLGKVPDLVTKVQCNAHSLILHHNQKHTGKNFMFHFVLDDDIIVAFGKPFEFFGVDVALCKLICQSKVNKYKSDEEKNKAYRKKPQKLYFVSDKQNCIVKCLRVPFSTEKSLILSENTLGPFLKSLERYNIKARISAPPETSLRERQKRRHNLSNRLNSKMSNEMKESKTKINKSSTHHENYSSPKVVVQKSSSMNAEENITDDLPKVKKQTSKIHKLNKLPEDVTIESKREVLEKLKTALEKHMPVFKICSSKLHKFHYVKRAKSYISIPVGDVVQRVLYKPVFQKVNRKIEVKKCLPIGCTNSVMKKYTLYDLRMSLMSGLTVKDVAGIDSEYACIKQYYIDKGPQCKSIQHEEYRLFLRNGNIVIKRCDGNVDILHCSGSIFNLDVPYLLKTETQKSVYREKNLEKLKKQQLFGSNSTSLYSRSKSLSTFQKYLQKTLRRRYKHLIDGDASRYQISRRAHLKAQKRYCQDAKQFYLLQTYKGPFPQYSLITPEGMKINVTNNKVSQEQKYYVATDTDFRTEETLTEREDGTYCLLSSDGVLITHFPDGTRIKTWFVVDIELIYADMINFKPVVSDKAVQATTNRQSMSAIRSSRSRHRSSSIFIPDLAEGWVSIHMYYEYTHPNYATVLFGGDNNEMKITLPNESVITSEGNGPYNFAIDKQVEAEISSERIALKGSGCFQCGRKCFVTMNIEPFYYNEPITGTGEFLTAKDSYGKIFMVDYEGHTTRNESIRTEKFNDNGCLHHFKSTFERFFVVKRDFSGYYFWNPHMFIRRNEATGRSFDAVAQTYGYDPSKPSAIEFKTFVYKPFHARYTLPYEDPSLMLTKYKTKHSFFQRNPSYTMQRIVYPLPETEAIQPLYQKLVENDENAVQATAEEKLQTLLRESLEESVAHENQEKESADTVVDNTEFVKKFEPAIQLCDRWYKWQEECKKYKEFINHQYVPLYFKSKFGEKFSDENRNEKLERDEGNKTSVLDGESRSDLQKKVEEQDGAEPAGKKRSITKSSGIGSKQYTSKPKPIVTKQKCDQMSIKKQKINERKETDSMIITTTKETIEITGASDFVILYNQGADLENLDTDKKKLAIESGYEEKCQSSQQNPHKMLILTDVLNESKEKIAHMFLEMNTNKKLDASDHEDTVVLQTNPTYHNEDAKQHMSPNVYSVKSVDILIPPTPVNSTVPCSSAKPEIVGPHCSATLQTVVEVLHSDKVSNIKVSPLDKDLGNKRRIPSRNETVVQPVLCRIERLRKGQENDSGSIHSIVSKTVDMLFELSPLKQTDQDNLVHGILKQANIDGKDLHMLSRAFKEEILIRDSSQSASALRTLIKMLKEHLGNVNVNNVKTVVNMENDANDTKYRVTMVLGNVITQLSEAVAANTGKITWENRLAILDKALSNITSANLNPNETKLLLESLDHAAENLISSDDASDEEKQRMLDSVLETINSYKETVIPSEKVASKPKIHIKQQPSKEYHVLEHKSNSSPLGNAATVLRHYSHIKGKNVIQEKSKRDIRSCSPKMMHDRVKFIKDIKTGSSSSSSTDTSKGVSEVQSFEASNKDVSCPASINAEMDTDNAPSIIRLSDKGIPQSLLVDSMISINHCEFCQYDTMSESRLSVDYDISPPAVTPSLLPFTSKVGINQPSSIILRPKSTVSEMDKNVSDKEGETAEVEADLPAIRRLPARLEAAEKLRQQFEEMNRNFKRNQQKSEEGAKVMMIMN